MIVNGLKILQQVRTPGNHPDKIKVLHESAGLFAFERCKLVSSQQRLRRRC
jgi:hypothetical protein